MEKKLKILPPSMPNFAFFEQKAGLRQDGFKTDGFPISDFTKDEAIEYGELMKQTFIEHWRKKKIQNTGTT